MYLKTKKNRIQEYIKGIDQSPLHFNFESSTTLRLDKESMSTRNLDEKIIKILTISKHFGSINTDGNVETGENKWRSSLDIWRHAIYYDPKITIYDVMSSLYKQEEKLVSLYCNRIHRRVFRDKSGDGYRWDIYGFCCKEMEDEYGLVFKDWERLNRKLLKRR